VGVELHTMMAMGRTPELLALHTTHTVHCTEDGLFTKGVFTIFIFTCSGSTRLVNFSLPMKRNIINTLYTELIYLFLLYFINFVQFIYILGALLQALVCRDLNKHPKHHCYNCLNRPSWHLKCLFTSV